MVRAGAGRPNLAALGIVALLAVILGINMVALKVAMRWAGPVTVQAIATTAAAVTMLLAAGAGGSLRLGRGQILPALACALTLTVLASLGIAFGVQRVGAGVSALLVSTTPIMSLALGRLLLRERHTWEGAAGVLLGLAGVAVIAFTGRGDRAELSGVAFLTAGAFFWSLSLVLMKRFARDAAPAAFVAWQTLLGVPFLLAAAGAAEGLAVRGWSGAFLLATLYAGVAAKGLSFFLQLAAVRLGSVVQVSAVAFLMPLVGAAAGVALLGERLQARHCYGALVILAGIALVLRSQPS